MVQLSTTRKTKVYCLD